MRGVVRQARVFASREETRTGVHAFGLGGLSAGLRGQKLRSRTSTFCTAKTTRMVSGRRSIEAGTNAADCRKAISNSVSILRSRGGWTTPDNDAAPLLNTVATTTISSPSSVCGWEYERVSAARAPVGLRLGDSSAKGARLAANKAGVTGS